MTRIETDFDSETDFLEVEEPKTTFKNIRIENEDEEDDDDDDIDENYRNYAQNAQFYVSEAKNES